MTGDQIMGTSYQIRDMNPIRPIQKIRLRECRIDGHLNQLSHNQ